MYGGRDAGATWERGGGAVSFTTGSELTDQEFSPVQFYHLPEEMLPGVLLLDEPELGPHRWTRPRRWPWQ